VYDVCPSQTPLPPYVGAGAVSFTQIVKAAEPVCTATLSWLILGSTISAPAALALVPIVAGVALASVLGLYTILTLPIV